MPEEISQDLNPTPSSSSQVRYEPAGFWLRFVASIIDQMLMSIAIMPFYLIGAAMMFGGIAFMKNSEASAFAIAGVIVGVGVMIIGVIGVAVFYVGWFYSRKGATPGKLVLKIKVVKEDTGEYLSFGRALYRDFIGKTFIFLIGMVFYLPLITLGFQEIALGIYFLFYVLALAGYVMAGFRDDKKALHDIIAKSRTIRQVAG